MELWTFWLILASICIVIEVFTQMVWTLCIAIGAIIAMTASFIDNVSVSWQIVILAISAIIAYITLVPKVKEWHRLQSEKEGKNARTGMDALLGRKAIVTHEIKPGHTGRVRIDGDSWQCIATDNSVTVDRGTEVTVTAYNSIILTVKPIQ